MSVKEKTPVTKTKSGSGLLMNRLRSDLSQTRRHSWFGTTQNDQVFDRRRENLSMMQEIEEEKEEEDQSTPEAQASWWDISKWSKANHENQKPSLRQRKSNSNEKNFENHGNGTILTKFVGLQRKEKEDKTTTCLNASNATTDSSSSKRRSGLSSWLIGAQKVSERDSVFNEDIKRTEPSSVKAPWKPPLEMQDPRTAQRRATVHYSSTGRPSLMDFRRQHFQNTLRANEVKALEQLKDVVRDVIIYRLRQRHLQNRVSLSRPQSKDRWLFREMIFIFSEMEKMNNSRFTDISKQIGITLRSEHVLRKVFLELSGEIITTEKKSHHQNGMDKPHERTNKKVAFSHPAHLPGFGSRYTEITWGRLCAVVAVAGGLAVDCVQQGHADLVNYIIDYMGDFAREEGILPWIVDQGGWDGLRDMTYEVAVRGGCADPCYFNKVANSALAFVFCTVSSVIAALTIGHFTKTATN